MWMKVDDKLHAHRKTRSALRSSPDKRRDASPMGLWVLAGSWSADAGTDGWVPVDELDRWDDDWEALADRLVKAGYWWPEHRAGEPGYGFVDWGEWNTSRERQSESGRFGNHDRWHMKRGIVKPDCEFCPSEPDSDDPDSPPDIAPRSAPDSGAMSDPTSGANRVPDSENVALPDPTRPVPVPERPSSSEIASDPDLNPSVEVSELCNLLAEWIERNGSKKPKVGKRWHQACRLLMSIDGRTAEQVRTAIEWSQRDPFWSANILSMPKLREKYDTLRAQAQRGNHQPQRGEIDWDAALGRAQARDQETA